MIKLLENRRSIRKFKEQKIESDKIDKLKKAALLAPSSRSIRPVRFIFTEERETIDTLSLAKDHGSRFLKDAPLAVVVYADETKSDVWIEDSSIAAIIIQLTAESIGLKSCWIQIRNREKKDELSSEGYIKDLLEIPENYRVLSVVAIGYPDESKEPYRESDLDYSKIKENRY